MDVVAPHARHLPDYATFIKVTSKQPKMFDLDAFLDFQDFKKGIFWIPFSTTKALKEHESKFGKHPCRDPSLHETMIITVPLGPTVFYKVVF